MFGRNGGGGGGSSSGRQVCKFFLEGRCRFGDSCKNEHPQSQAQNRFAALSTGGGSVRGRSNAFGGGDQGADNTRADLFAITADGLRKDLTTGGQDGERPLWPLSAYGPGVHPPRQLIEGDVEQSPEEMRLQYYLALAAGSPQEYIQREQALSGQMDQQIQKILSDLEGAKKYVADGQHQHPNRNDMVIKPTRDFPKSASLGSRNNGFGSTTAFGASSNASASSNNPFGTSSTTPSAFGQPSGLSAPKSAFGAPSAIGQTSGFGQASTLGSAGSGFGKASSLGGGASAFGQASSLGQASTFGGGQKTAAFGQASQPSAFGSNSLGSTQPAAQPAFGQSAFGQASKPAAFGAVSQPAFGQASKPAGLGPATQTAFGQASKPSGFGQPAFAQASQPSAFGQASQPSAFGSSQQSNAASFGQPSGFAAAANTASPFASVSQEQAQSQQQSNNPFAQSAKPSGFGTSSATPVPSGSRFTSQASEVPFANNTPNTSSFGQSGFGQAKGSAFGGLSLGNTAPAAASTHNVALSSGKQSWKSQQRIQRDATGKPLHYQVPDPSSGTTNATKLVRIWFPEGTPQTLSPLAEAAPEAYAGELGKTLKGIYEFARENGAFKDGIMPEIPPKQEWVGFDI